MVSIHQAKLEAITSMRHHDNVGKPLQAVLFRLQVKVARNYGNKQESNLNYFLHAYKNLHTSAVF